MTARYTCLVLACLFGAIGFARAERALPRESLNCAYLESNEVEALLRAEEKCLARLGGTVTRIGNVLEIKLKNGDSKTFLSNFEACEEGDAAHCIQYWLSAYLPKQRAVVLKIHAWESRAVALVNVDSGNETDLEDEPHLSPSGDRFAVVKGSESEHVEKDVAIFAATSDPPVLEFAYSRPERTYALYSFVRWEGETRLKLKIYTRVNGKRDPENFDTEAVRTRTGWQLRGPFAGP